MDIQAVRVALAAAADTISGLRCHDYVPGTINPPTFFIAEEEITFDLAMGRALDTATFTCLVMTSMGANRTGQQALTPYLAGSGSKSIKAALEAARGAPGVASLSGAADDLRVESVRGHQISEVAGVEYWSATFTVRVWG